MPKVKVDWTKCNGCGTCVDSCPALVFELQDLPDYPDSKNPCQSEQKTASSV